MNVNSQMVIPSNSSWIGLYRSTKYTPYQCTGVRVFPTTTLFKLFDVYLIWGTPQFSATIMSIFSCYWCIFSDAFKHFRVNTTCCVVSNLTLHLYVITSVRVVNSKLRYINFSIDNAYMYNFATPLNTE